MHYHQRMKDIREKAKISQYQLARIVGVAHSTICGYERGNVGHTILTAKKIVDALSSVSGEKFTIDEVFFHEKDLTSELLSEAELAEKNKIRKELELREQIKDLYEQIKNLKED